ncbi:MAG: hypothetical protein QM665_06310 [Desulfovibrio sp.]
MARHKIPAHSVSTPHHAPIDMFTPKASRASEVNKGAHPRITV